MITLDNIGFEYGGRWLFRNTTLQIKPGDRIGLVGRNGAGKTTLLRLLTEDITPVEGKLSMMKGLKIAELKQEMQSLDTGKTVLEIAKEAFAEALQLQADIEQMLADPRINEDGDMIHELTEKQIRLEILGGYQLETKAGAVLAGLGFSEADQNRPFNEFSGGWRMRVMLAQLLLGEPDLLLLDEPTNHLDLPSIQWLEEYLSGFGGAFIIVSHDRDFLDKLVQRVVEVGGKKLTDYTGNYSFYLKERAIRREQHEREYENQQKMIAEAERFITRFRAKASKAKQAQSKIKMLENLERIDPPEAEAATVSFSFQPSVTPGKIILEVDAKRKAYGDKVIVKGSEARIIRGDKIALIGANGLGKSTVLRMVAGTEPFDGERRLGHNVMPGFFAQHQLDALNLANDLMEELSDHVMQKGEAFVRGVLGGFLFTGDDVFKKIKVLSGGEKSRVALAKTLLDEANFLLLDEPTNHLDIQSIQILCRALQQYEGTYIVVSHDRYFLREVANKIWYIEQQQLKEFPGTYEEFEYHMAQKAGKAPAKPAPKQAVHATAHVPVEKEKDKGGNGTKSDYHQDKERKRQERRLKNEFQKVEETILELETKREGLLAEMAKPEMAAQFDKLQELQHQLNKLDKQLSPAHARWEELALEMEEWGIEV